MTQVLHAQGVHQGLTVKAIRGDRAALLAFDLDSHLTKDLTGFAVQVTSPDGKSESLRNRLNYEQGVHSQTAAADHPFTPSHEAPFQKFRWFHAPHDVEAGEYRYKVTAMYLPPGKTKPEPGPSVTVALEIQPKPGPFELGFTRGNLSSQAYMDKWGKDLPFGPTPKSLDYDYASFEEKYVWLGFHARKMMVDFIDTCVKDPHSTLDLFAYDIDEPRIVKQLEALKGRLRAVLDDASLHTKPGAMEIEVLKRLRASAGEKNVVSGNFKRFAHNKIFIRKVNGKPHSVLTGSANFSLRGLYVQANSVLHFQDPDVAEKYEEAFETAFTNMKGFAKTPISQQWFDFEKPGLPRFGVAFSPHADGTLSLDRVSKSIAKARSSVIYAVMELDGGGKVLEELRGLPKKDRLFSYGVTQHSKGLSLYRPGHKNGVLVGFEALKGHMPPSFHEEWSGGMGQVIHHKFAVVDFNDADPVVFAGSSNLAEGGEEANGDNLLAIYDRAIVQAYAVEGIRLVDHYEFRDSVQGASQTQPLILQGSKLEKGAKPWWQRFYDPEDISYVERTLFVR
ncbi:phospholipase D-like domain-containing protein [Hyalangium sp.]|uniref:phospholipase D-like domain-containing protein n=1 Tax=Hyalangium sp. TaxID=2028555 RepID=UPI002D4104BA|nr:phospholipase D-like domain-containing protein [Hyalangium sp.]HYI00534.1 phospholipase D-like domain-containing protein [Hyalangium sp.]